MSTFLTQSAPHMVACVRVASRGIARWSLAISLLAGLIGARTRCWNGCAEAVEPAWAQPPPLVPQPHDFKSGLKHRGWSATLLKLAPTGVQYGAAADRATLWRNRSVVASGIEQWRSAPSHGRQARQLSASPLDRARKE